jgi:hypothetical protein
MKSALFTGGASPSGVLREIARTQQTKHEKQMRVIDPCLVAAKLDAARNFLLPEAENQILADERYREALWFLQWVSSPENYAGGLSKFALDFIEECAHKIGPRCLVERGKRVLKREDLEAVLDEVPHVHQLFPDRETERWLAAVTSGLEFGDDLSRETLAELRNARIAKLSELDFSALQTPFIDAARADLANYFFKVCIDQEAHITEPLGFRSTDPARPGCFKNGSRLWYWPGMWDCLFAWIEQRAAKVRATIAETSVTKEVFRWLDLARKSRRGVMIVGNSRFGKTEAIRCWADMYPSRARVIETPSSSVESELLTAIARSLGIRTTSSTKCTEMRSAIDVVLRQSQVMLIFDEFQFMMPSNAGRRSDPPRLNYVRRAIMDLPLATAFICTPQSWKRVEKNYLKATGYTIEQFEGRLLRSAVVLPDDLPREEMIAVARIHFPDLSAAHLEWIVRHVRAFQGCVLSCIENIARLSRIHAEEAGRASLRMDDIKQAIAECLPSRRLGGPDREQPDTPATGERPLAGDSRQGRTQRADDLRQVGQHAPLLRLDTDSGDRSSRIGAADLVAAD